MHVEEEGAPIRLGQIAKHGLVDLGRGGDLSREGDGPEGADGLPGGLA